MALTLEQPIFAANTAKWNRRIEPVRYREAKARFMTASEQVALSTINYYFTLLLARENVASARQNLANAEKLYAVAQEKRSMGQISKTICCRWSSTCSTPDRPSPTASATSAPPCSACEHSSTSTNPQR